MVKNPLYILAILLASGFNAQVAPQEYIAQAVGGKEQVEQVLETQMTLPKALLTSNFDVQVTAFFDLDSLGYPTYIKFKSGLNNALRAETARVLRFIKFVKTQNEAYETDPYTFSFQISTERYNKFMKQRSKLNQKKNIPADSSFIIYTRAERAPEYYKNGEEGLRDFVLAELEYPKLAIEKSVEGTVIVEFVVETNGYVTGILLKQGVGAGCAEEALRLVKNTKWQPAVLNNKLVRYKMTYPITFSLRNTTRDASSTIGQ